MSTTLTGESLAAAFPDNSITTVPADALPAGLSDPVARRVLTEVGFPESVVDCVYFEDLNAPIVTLREFRKDQPSPAEVAEDFVIGLVATADIATICLNGTTGECRFVGDRRDAVSHAARNLEDLLSFCCQLSVALFDLSSRTPEPELDLAEERLITEFRATDPEIAESPWRETIRRSIGGVIQQ